MYAGKVVEEGDVRSILKDPQHPYTQGLIASVPKRKERSQRLYSIPGTVPKPGSLKRGCAFAPVVPSPLIRVGRRRRNCTRWETEGVPDVCYTEKKGANALNNVLLKLEHVKKYYPVKGGPLRRTIGYVRPWMIFRSRLNGGKCWGSSRSGCGKSTLGRVALRLLEPTDGRIVFDGRDITHYSYKQMRQVRKKMQIVLQDPSQSLNPRHKLEKIVGEPLLVHGCGNKKERRERVMHLLNIVGLSDDYAVRYPHQLSGGQQQRIGIARALALNPKLIVADEPVSALDVSVQSQVLNLLQDLKDEFKLTYVFISHDLSVIRTFCNQVGVDGILRKDRGTGTKRKSLRKAQTPVHGSIALFHPHRRPRRSTAGAHFVGRRCS